MKTRLKDLRKQRGISQIKLSMDLHLNQNTISRYETGERGAVASLMRQPRALFIAFVKQTPKGGRQGCSSASVSKAGGIPGRGR